MNAPIRYMGGKGTMIQTLLEFFPDPSLYSTYVDAYGGSGVVLLKKPRCEVEVYNDLSRNAYALYRVLVTPDLFEAFRRKCELAFFDETLSNECRMRLRDDDLDAVERAFCFWYVTRTRHGGGIGGFPTNRVVRRGMSKSTSDFLSSVEGLPALHDRLRSVIVRHSDALDLIREFDSPRTLIYLDPPYVHATRSADNYYEVEADDAHHRALVETLNAVRHAYVVLSGYDNAIYAGLQGFRQDAFEVNTISGNYTPKTKVECVWRNFADAQLALWGNS